MKNYKITLLSLALLAFGACQATLPGALETVDDGTQKDDSVVRDDTVCTDENSDLVANNLYEALLINKLTPSDDTRAAVDEFLLEAFKNHMIIEEYESLTKLISEDPSLLTDVITMGDCFFVDETDTKKAAELYPAAWTSEATYKTEIKVTTDALISKLQAKKIEELKGNTYKMPATELNCKLCGTTEFIANYKNKRVWCPGNPSALMNNLCTTYALKNPDEIKALEAQLELCKKDQNNINALKLLAPVQEAIAGCAGDAKCEAEHKVPEGLIAVQALMGETCAKDSTSAVCAGFLYDIAACKNIEVQITNANNRCPDIAKNI